jgi:hypothetical protein
MIRINPAPHWANTLFLIEVWGVLLFWVFQEYKKYKNSKLLLQQHRKRTEELRRARALIAAFRDKGYPDWYIGTVFKKEIDAVFDEQNNLTN